MKVIERRAGVTHNSYKQDQMKNCSQNATRAISRRCQPPEAVPKNRKLQNRKDQQKAKDVPGEQGKACPKSQREVTGQDGEKSRSPPRRMSAIKLQQEAQRKEKVQLQISQQMIIESKLLKLEMKFEREKRHRQAHLQYWRQHEERRNGFVPQQLQQEPRNDQPQLSMLQQLSVLSQPAQTGADARFQNRDNRSFHLQREEHFKLKSISDWLDSDGDSKQKRNPGLHKNIQRCPLTNAKMTEGPCEMAGSTMQSEQGKLPEKNVGLTSSKSKSNRNKVAGMVSSETKTEHFSQESRAGENGVENNRQPRSKSDTDRSMKSLVRDPAKGIQSPGIQSSGIQSPGIQSSGIQSPGIQSSGMPSPPNFSYPSSSTEHFSCSPENECLVEGSENQRRSKMSDKLDSINAFLSSTLSGEDTLLKVFKCGARKSRSDIHSYKTFANASLRTNNSKCCGEVEKETWKLTPNKLNSSPNIVTSDSSKFNKTVDSSQPIMSADQRNTFMVSGDGTEHTCCQEYVTDSKNVGFNTACLDQYTAAPDAISASSTCSELYSKYSSIAVNPEAMAWSPVGTVYTSNFVREAGERMATADRVPCTGHVASEKNTQEGDNERQRTFPSEFEDNLSLAGTSVSCKTTGSDCSPRACDTDFWSHVVRSTINPEVATNNMCPVEVNPRTFDTNTNASASSLTLSLRDTFTEDGDTVSNVSDISSDVGSVAPYSNNFTSSWVKDPKRFGITHPPDGNCGSATSQKPVTSLPSKNTDRLSQTNSPRLVRRNHRAPVHIQFSEGIQMVSVKRLDQHLHARDPQQHGHLLNHFKFPTICIQEVSRANLTTSPEHKSRIKGATDQQRSMESSSHSQGGRHTSLQRPEKQASPPDSTRDKMVNYINQRLEMLDKQKVKLVDIKRTKRKRPARTAPERCVTTSQAGELNNCHSNSVNKSQSNVQTKLEVQGTASMMYIEKAAFLS